ncbi:MAG TPA: TraR/DksA family transcriptional regulator [Candidatus Sulfomarinibacteraceae bacterium]|nr:TraR/DksA family transcriptional regulator [Candidatus Sulfomarinibacteraceae bacterium]
MDNVLDTESIRQQLEDEAKKLQESITQKLDGNNEGRNPDRSDLAQAYATRERSTALLAIERERLEQVQNALQRLDDGTYGYCMSCGENISPERLEILPHATLCVNCQANRE